MKRKALKALIIAAGLAVAAAMTAVAANGWTQENGQWVYYNTNGKVYNEWKQSSDGNWYYLGNDGYMVTNSLVDGDERYVGSDGRMITSSWRQIDSKWYYFDQNGKMLRDTSKTISGTTYYFDSDGAMKTGWIEYDDNYYYFDDQSGKMLTGTWKKLAPQDDVDDTNDSSPLDDTDATYWYYFQASGKVVKSSGSGDYKETTIGDNRFCFDNYGRMVTGWAKLSDKSPAIAGYKYYNDSTSIGTYGAAHVGWLSAYPPENDGFGTEVQWFYFDSKGVPAYGTDVSDGDTEETLQAKFKRLTRNGTTKSYLFDQYGNPVYGLRRVKTSSGQITSMYFGTRQESCLQLGDKSITDADGVTATFYFDSRGYGYTGVKNDRLYYMGKLQKAVDDTYAYYTVNGKTYLVTKSGTLKKNYNKNKNADEVDYRSNASGLKDGGTAGDSELDVPAFVTSGD